MNADYNIRWLDAIRTGKVTCWKDREPVSLLRELTPYSSATYGMLERFTGAPVSVLETISYGWWYLEMSPEEFIPLIQALEEE